MTRAKSHFKQQLMRELEKLPLDKWVEVLDFVLFLRGRVVQEKARTAVPSLPASSLPPDRSSCLGWRCLNRCRAPLR